VTLDKSLPSRTDAATTHGLRAVLAQARNQAIAPDSPAVRELLSALEWFISEVCGVHSESVAFDGIDGVHPLVTRTPTPQSVELYGLCNLLPDSRLAPIYVHASPAPTEDRILWVVCKIGDDCEPEIRPGFDRLGKELYRLEQRTTPIKWVYMASLGQPPHNESLYVVSECCPVGCGGPVVLLRSISNGIPLCYCYDCGCAPPTPQESQFSSGLYSIAGPGRSAPAGVDTPTAQEVRTWGLAGDVLRGMAASQWGTSVERVNIAIVDE